MRQCSAPSTALLAKCLLLCLTARCAADKTFLYEGSSEVHEVAQAGADELIALKDTLGAPNTRHPHLTVFYAHWCGHCQLYAPKFKAVAAQFLHSPVSVSDPKGLGEAFTGENVQFYAVNCVKFSTLCDAFGVKAYPTVKAFDFPDDVPSLSWGGAAVKAHALDAYLRQHTARAPAAGSAQSGAEGSAERAVDGVALQEWLVRTSSPQPLGLRADPAHRARDAAETLAFLVVAELAHRPAVNASHKLLSGGGGSAAEAAVRRGVLAQLSTMLAVFLPEDERAPVFRTVAAELQREVPDEAAVLGALGRSRLEDLRWTSCGVMAAQTQAGPEGIGGIAEGYTCGLWMMLHLLTVAAQPHSDAVSTHRVMSSIRSLVNLHFRCAECRHHFLAAFDGCSWGRCEVGQWDYRALQLWLWTFHNKVTHRIMSYRFLHGQFSAPVMALRYEGDSIAAESLYPDVFWPSSAECKTCRLSGHSLLAAAVDPAGAPAGPPANYRATAQVKWDEDAVIRFLRAQYRLPNGAAGGADPQDYAFINRDIDLSSVLDGAGRTRGQPSTGGWAPRRPVLWAAPLLLLWAALRYRHVLCRWLLALSGGLLGSPRMSATRKPRGPAASLKDIV